MKSKILIVLSIILTAGFLVTSYFFIIENTLKRSIIENNGDYVVLLHGLGRSSWSMQKIGKHLSEKGYKVININYPTRSDTIENLVENHLKNELQSKYIDRTKRISFVTHSMGGIMVRYFLENNELDNIHRVVMLAPPNKGSETADKWANSKIMSYIMGPAIQEMTTDKKSLANTLPPPKYEVGIIAGEHDEKVSVERTKLENMKDFLLVQREHTYIMQSDEVFNAVEQFLQEGKFQN